MRRFHQYGVPITEAMKGEVYHEDISLHVRNYYKSSYSIEFFRFDSSWKENPRVSGHPDIISQVPHLAFIVDDLAQELEDKEVIYGPNEVLEDWTVAWILEDGILVELIGTSLTDDEILKMAQGIGRDDQ